MEDDEFRVPARGAATRRDGSRRLDGRARPLATGRSFGSAVLGEARMMRQVWNMSAFDMLIKGLLLVLYATMWATHIAYAVPLVAHASIVSPIVYFVWGYVLSLVAAVLAVISLVDTYDVGLHTSGLASDGTPEIRSYRDRSLNLMASLVALAANLLLAIYWTIWFAGNTDISTVAALVAEPYIASQYFGMAGVSFAVYFASPVFLAAVYYASTRYAFSVALDDDMARHLSGQSLRSLVEGTA